MSDKISLDFDIKKKISELKDIILSKVKNSYSPYSKFRVVAALITKNSTYFGVNIENRSFGLTNCAERSAIFSAISNGDREFLALFIYSPDYDKPLPPCGACRQVISEFSKDLPIIMLSKNFEYEVKKINELLPDDSLDNLAENIAGQD